MNHEIPPAKWPVFSLTQNPKVHRRNFIVACLNISRNSIEVLYIKQRRPNDRKHINESPVTRVSVEI